MTSKRSLIVAAVAAVLVVSAFSASAQQGGYGPGMMGGYGPGPGGGYGPGMMGGYGPGMMGGYGPGPGGGYGPGMMGGYGQGRMGPWMMGPGGYMGPWMMGPGWGGPGSGAQQADLALSAGDVKGFFERWLAWQGNPRLTLGDVKEKDADTITVDIVTKDKDALVQRYAVNRHTGFYRPDEG